MMAIKVLNRDIPGMLLCAVALLCGDAAARAQGSPTVLRTGGGSVTETYPLLFPASVDNVRLQFNFGFGTDETPQGGQLLDSFTVTLQDNSMQSTAIYLTADASGVAWAPATPGTISMDPNSINRSPISFGNVQPSHANETAYHVDALIPSQFAGTTATLYFDLFDNGNSVSSLGWFSDVAVVPEPGTAVLGGIGAAIFIFFCRFRPRNFLK